MRGEDGPALRGTPPHSPESSRASPAQRPEVAAPLSPLTAPTKGPARDLMGTFSPMSPICQSFLGDFNPQKVPCRGL